MAAQDALAQLQWFIRKRDEIAHADKLRDATRGESHIHEQVIKADRVLLVIIGQERGRTRRDHTLQRLARMHQHRLSGQETRVKTADFRQAQKAILDARHHHPNSVHVSRQEERRPRRGRVPAPQGVDGAEAAGENLVRQWPPALEYQIRRGGLVSRKSRAG